MALKPSVTAGNLLPHETPQQAQRDVAELRGLSLQQRGEMIIAACRDAALIRNSRIRAGLPDVEPAPWPASTFEFLRKCAANGQR